jgi:hypothetical protein
MIGIKAMKKCTQCFLEKPLSDYYNLNNTADGKQSMCISCYKVYFKRWRETRKGMTQSEFPTSKVCAQCGVEKPVSQFGKRSVSKDKLMYDCKPCWRKKTQKALTRHYEKRRNEKE